jgi:hypothetical protein
VKVTAKLFRNGAGRQTSVDIPMDGTGMRGNANMFAPQAYASSLTYGRKLSQVLLFNLTVDASGGSQRAEPPPSRLSHGEDDPPPCDVSDDHLTVLKRAAAKSDRPPSDKQIEFLASLMRQRGEPASAVLDDQGPLSGRDAWVAIDACKAVRP